MTLVYGIQTAMTKKAGWLQNRVLFYPHKILVTKPSFSPRPVRILRDHWTLLLNIIRSNRNVTCNFYDDF